MRLITLLAVLLPCACWGAPVVLTWTNPTQWDNGTALAAANIVSYRIQWTGACPGFGFVAPENDIVTQGNAESRILEVTPGTRCFLAAVTARDPNCTVTATETCLRESPWSNIATKVVVGAPRVPEPPSNLSTADAPSLAYTVQFTGDQIVALEVGTVPPGVTCDPTQYVNTGGARPVDDKTLFLVPVASVEFLPSVTGRDIAVFAECQG